MAKGFTKFEDGWREQEEPPLAKKWLVRFKELDGIGSWLTYAPTIPDCAVVILGGVTELPQGPVARKLANRGGIFEATPRHLTVFDVDSMPIPTMPDWSRPALVEAAKYVRNQLGPIFKDVTCVAQLTAKMGVTASLSEFRGRLWFWCDEPIDQRRVAQVIKEMALPDRILDASVLRASHVIYTARPVLVDERSTEVADPIQSRWIGIKGERDEVTSADLPAAPEVVDTNDEDIVVLDDAECLPDEVEQLKEKIRRCAITGSRHHFFMGATFEAINMRAEKEDWIEFLKERFTAEGREARPGEAEELWDDAMKKTVEGNAVVKNKSIRQLFKIEDELQFSEKPLPIALSGGVSLAVGTDQGNARLFLDKIAPSGGVLWYLESWWFYEQERAKYIPHTEKRNSAIKQKIMKLDPEISNSDATTLANTVQSLCYLSSDGDQFPQFFIDAMQSGLHPTVRCDANNMIAFKNGVIAINDLKQETLPVPQRMGAEFFTRIMVPVDYDAEAACPIFDRFMEQTFPMIEDRQHALRILGYFLFPDNRYQKMFIFNGVPRSGKSTLVRILEDVFKGAVVAMGLSNFVETHGLERLTDARVIAVQEGASISGMKEQMQAEITDQLKAISGGDSVRINPKNKTPISARIPGKILITGNSLPPLIDPSGALFARVVPLKFSHRMPDHLQDDQLNEKIRNQELPGVVKRLVEGARDLIQRGGFAHCEVTESTATLLDDLRNDTMPVLSFLRERTVRDPTSYLGQAELFTSYRTWSMENGRAAGNAKAFKSDLRSALSQMGIPFSEARHACGKVIRHLKFVETFVDVPAEDPPFILD
jgi:P4 family phage/plasmid primase-like protien